MSGIDNSDFANGKPPADCELCGVHVAEGEGKIMIHPEPGARFCSEEHLHKYLAQEGYL